MTGMLDRKNFLNYCHRILQPLALFGVAKRVVDKIANREARFAYYHNPHIVFTRLLHFRADGEDEVRHIIQACCDQAAIAFEGQQPNVVTPDQSLGGVPEGCSDHDELYFEAEQGTGPHSLHQRGRSFRVRVTTQRRGSDLYSERILLVLTRYPVPDDQLGTIRDGTYWKHLDLRQFPAFAPLDSLRSALVHSTAVPSVVDCFVVYLRDELAVATLLDELATDSQLADLHIAARFRKTSIKFNLRTWRQDAVSGDMDPRWAYLSLDRVHETAAVSYPISTTTRTTPWHDLRQLELEVGPSVGMTKAGLVLIAQLDRQLPGLVGELVAVYGRKIHRLLEEHGYEFGPGKITTRAS